MGYVRIEFTPTQEILLKRHLNRNGKGQLFLAQNIRRLADPYAPMDTGQLKNSAFLLSRNGETLIVYPAIYARYHWHGKVMVGRAPKRLTNRNMRYRNGSKRGPFWVKRMWADRGNEIVRSVALFCGGRAGGR